MWGALNYLSFANIVKSMSAVHRKRAAGVKIIIANAFCTTFVVPDNSKTGFV